MKMSNRQRQMLELLLSRTEEVTAAEIAAEIQISARTVHRELPELEAVLSACGLTLHKKSGIGLRLVGKEEQLACLRGMLFQGDRIELTPEERKALMLCLLLEAEEPVKLFALAHELHVTVPTVSADLDELEKGLGKLALTLVRRRGYGIQLDGSEAAKRGALSRLAREHLEDSDLFGKQADHRSRPLVDRLLTMAGKAHLLQVEQALWQWEERWATELSEAAYTELLIALSVAVARFRRGFTVARPKERARGGESAVAAALPPRSELLAGLLEAALSLRLPDAEIAYCGELLAAAADEPAGGVQPADEAELLETVLRLTRRMEERAGIPLTGDRLLREGLLNHMEPSLQRLREGGPVRNPLLGQIKKDYAELFGWVREAVDTTLPALALPDEEIGFLVMHFGASLERQKRLTRSVKAIIVCTSGIGSSRMLAVRLGKELPQIEIISYVSWYEAARIPAEAYDVIISTVDLPLAPGQYVKLSPLLSGEETERLRRFVQEAAQKRPAADSSAPLAGPPSAAMEDLHKYVRYLHEITELLDGFKLFHMERSPQRKNVRDIFERMVAAASGSGGAAYAAPVAQLLLEREAYGSQVIPETDLALLHTRSEHIQRPLLALFRMAEPLKLGPDSAEVNTVVLMLGPAALARESLEVLSEISAMLLQPEVVELLGGGTEADIRQAMAGQLLSFFVNKIETGRRYG